MLACGALLSYIGVAMYCHGIYTQAVHVQCLLALVPHIILTYSCQSITSLTIYPLPPFKKIWDMVQRWSLDKKGLNGADNQAAWCSVGKLGTLVEGHD